MKLPTAVGRRQTPCRGGGSNDRPDREPESGRGERFGRRDAGRQTLEQKLPCRRWLQRHQNQQKHQLERRETEGDSRAGTKVEPVAGGQSGRWLLRAHSWARIAPAPEPLASNIPAFLPRRRQPMRRRLTLNQRATKRGLADCRGPGTGPPTGTAGRSSRSWRSSEPSASTRRGVRFVPVPPPPPGAVAVATGTP